MAWNMRSSPDMTYFEDALNGILLGMVVVWVWMLCWSIVVVLLSSAGGNRE